MLTARSLFFLILICGGQMGPLNSLEGRPAGTNNQNPFFVNLPLRSRLKRNPVRTLQSTAGRTFGLRPDRREALSLTGPGGYGYGDGTNCETGQSPWDPDEAAKVGATYKTELRGHLYLGLGYDLETDSREYGPTCKSGKCYLDGGTWTLTCGTPSYRDGLSCALGLQVPSEAEVNPNGTTFVEDDLVPYGAWDKLRKNCESKNCTFLERKPAFVCGSHYSRVRPLEWLLGLSVLQALKL